jgi:hypothetical protein
MGDDASNGGGRPPPQRDEIVASVMRAGITFWLDPDARAYARVPGPDGQVQRYPVRSNKVFAVIVREIFGRDHPREMPDGAIIPGSIGDSAWRETVPALEAMGIRAPRSAVAVRLIRHGGDIVIDLGGPAWSVVRVWPGSWAHERATEAPLIRPGSMRALPVPRRAPDSLDRLRRLLNIQSVSDLQLVVAWLVAALHPSGPYAVLAFDGEQGSGKSTTCRLLRQLVDPNQAPLRAMPRTEDDLLIAAQNSRVVGIDNVSNIDSEMADALCRLATGAGLSKRTLYSDLDETIVAVSRPVLLNGIPSLLARGDLADRAIAITLPAIPDANRRTEEDVRDEFEAAAPGIFALLLDGLALALERMPTLKLPRMPRMADFTRLACAAAPVFGWTEDDMLRALEGNRAMANTAVIESDPIAGAVMDEAAGGRWEGTATQLLDAVNAIVPPEVKNARDWPRDGARLSTRLRRLAPALRRSGCIVTMPTTGGREGRKITVEMEPPRP